MLTPFPCKLRLTHALEVPNLIHALPIILTRVPGAVIHIPITVRTRPSLLTNTLIVKEPIHTEAMGAGFRGTEVNLRLTSLPREPPGAGTAKVIHEVRTV
jgi:hypothetical protein